VALSSPDARHAIEAAEAELDRRYGPGTDQEPFDPASFAAPRGSFLVAHLAGTLVGAVGLRGIAEDVGEVKRLWVAQEFRRLGIGAALMEAVEADGRGLGLTLIELETGPLQPEAVSLYASSGWELVDELPIPVSDYGGALRFLKRYGTDESS
jgi:GNAT superfamily N-acetyltransferase